MRTFDQARFVLDLEMVRRHHEGRANDVVEWDVCVCEDGKGAIAYVTMQDGEILYAGFGFGSTIDPGQFDPEPYLAAFLQPRTIN